MSASLPGVARRRGVPGALPDRARCFRGDPRYARAEAGDHRQRRLRLHHTCTPDTQPQAKKTRRSLDMTAAPDTSTHNVGTPLSQAEAIASMGRYGYGWGDSDVAGASAKRGLSEDGGRDIPAKKNEPRVDAAVQAEGAAN